MLYFLTGTTASGKSAIAHKIAIEKNISILSLDSMAVYKGLDILTAKPTDVMRTEVMYYGLDIADTDQNFSVVDYILVAFYVISDCYHFEVEYEFAL